MEHVTSACTVSIGLLLLGGGVAGSVVGSK